MATKDTDKSAAGKLSKIDRHILRLLQKNGRISYTDLAREVGLSVTPCIERVKRLEKNGFIKGFTAKLNPTAAQCGTGGICPDTPQPHLPGKF